VDARSLVGERNLVALAVRHLTTDALGELPFEALGPTKSLLKRFFSAQPWVPSDELDLADAVGPGQGWWRHLLDADLTLAFGWVEGRFMIEVTSTSTSTSTPTSAAAGSVDGPSPPALAFEGPISEGPVTPEATPNPRTVMFRTGAIHEGQSRSYKAGQPVDDERVARLLQRFADIDDVMVATDFVAVTLRRPDRWEALLGPVLDVVTEELAGESPLAGPVDDRIQPPIEPVAPGAGQPRLRDRPPSRLERAWQELGPLRPECAEDLERIRAAASGVDAAHRQVAANLLRQADPEVARIEWSRLAADGSRLVRRAALDAMVDVGREDLRSLLEAGLGDDDAWVRWKAVRGLSELGPAASRGPIQALLSDRDFRVRQEARAALEHDSKAPG